MRNLLEAVGKTAVPCSDAIESGFCLELLAPYLRLFSFCDYTIQYPKEFVYSQISQTKYELFVHVMDRYCLDECGIMCGTRAKIQKKKALANAKAFW